jgi:hypothetical protein
MCRKRHISTEAEGTLNDLSDSLAWPGWQDGFDERIIKDENTLDVVNQYISNNPLVWANDKYFNGSQLQRRAGKGTSPVVNP